MFLLIALVNKLLAKKLEISWLELNINNRGKYSADERARTCYQHAVLKFLSGARMKNATLCERFRIEKRNAAQATKVIVQALDMGFIKPADQEHPRSGYIPFGA